MLLIRYVAVVVCWLINLLTILIVAQALLSWLPLSEDNAINRFLTMMTEPVVAPIRKLLSRFEFTQEMPIDFSPMIAILALWVLSSIVSIFQYV